MKTRTILLSTLLAVTLHATTMTDLFEAVKRNPSSKLDRLAVSQAEIGKEKAVAQLYPKIDLFAGFDHYNQPTNLLPVPPNEMAPLLKNPALAQPFSTTIKRAGVTASMPLFVKSIFTTIERAETLKLSAHQRKKLQLLQKEALLTGTVANWHYLRQQQKALSAKMASLKKSDAIIRQKVGLGRAPASAHYQIQSALDRIAIAQNAIDIQIETVKAILYKLTGLHLDKPVPLHQAGKIDTSYLFALAPLESKAKADALALKAEKEHLYPALVASGKYTYSDADAYNNDKDIDKEYGSYGIYLKMPLFDKNQYTRIEEAHLQQQKSKIRIAKTRLELEATAQRLKATLPLVEKSMRTARQNVAHQKKLLQIAKTAFLSERMTEEEYLRYEDRLADAKARRYALEAQKWQTIAQLALLYGNNLEGVIK